MNVSSWFRLMFLTLIVTILFIVAKTPKAFNKCLLQTLIKSCILHYFKHNNSISYVMLSTRRALYDNYMKQLYTHKLIIFHSEHDIQVRFIVFLRYDLRSEFSVRPLTWTNINILYHLKLLAFQRIICFVFQKESINNLIFTFVLNLQFKTIV